MNAVAKQPHKAPITVVEGEELIPKSGVEQAIYQALKKMELAQKKAQKIYRRRTGKQQAID